MIKFNFALLLVVLVAFSGNVFAMEADAGAGQSGFQVLANGADQAPEREDEENPNTRGNGQDTSGNNTAFSQPAQGQDVVPPVVTPLSQADQRLDLDRPTDSAPFFTKGRAAILACLGTATAYIVWKFFADKNKVTEQEIEEVLVD